MSLDISDIRLIMAGLGGCRLVSLEGLEEINSCGINQRRLYTRRSRTPRKVLVCLYKVDSLWQSKIIYNGNHIHISIEMAPIKLSPYLLRQWIVELPGSTGGQALGSLFPTCRQGHYSILCSNQNRCEYRNAQMILLAVLGVRGHIWTAQLSTWLSFPHKKYRQAV